MNSSILNNSMSGSISGLIATVGSSVIKESIKEVKNKSLTTIELCEWDSAYCNINKIIYSLDKSSLSLILLLRTRSNISSTNYLNVMYVISLIYCFYYSNI